MNGLINGFSISLIFLVSAIVVWLIVLSLFTENGIEGTFKEFVRSVKGEGPDDIIKIEYHIPGKNNEGDIDSNRQPNVIPALDSPEVPPEFIETDRRRNPGKDNSTFDNEGTIKDVSGDTINVDDVNYGDKGTVRDTAFREVLVIVTPSLEGNSEDTVTATVSTEMISNMENREFVIGRDDSCNLPIDPNFVHISGHHLFLQLSDNGDFVICDKKSTNGSFLRLNQNEWLKLENNVKIKIENDLVVRLAGENTPEGAVYVIFRF